MASTSAHHLKRNSLEVKAQNGSILRSRPSSPAPRSPLAASVSLIDDGDDSSVAIPASAGCATAPSSSRPHQKGINDNSLWPNDYFAISKQHHSGSTGSGSSTPLIPGHRQSNHLSGGKLHAPTPVRSHLSTLAQPSHDDSSGASTPTGILSVPDDFANYTSANERSPLLLSSVQVERPSTPGIQQREWQRIPHDYEQDFDIPTFLSTERGGFIRPPTLRSRVKLLWTQTIANAISTFFLLIIIVWALASRATRYLSLHVRGLHKPRLPRPWDDPAKWEKEKLVKDVKYYAASCGFEIQDQEVITKDGYKLRVHKVIAPGQKNRVKSDGRGGFPVIIQHGLFQSSGSFVTSEERSIAFWLAEKGGYQVYLGNNRAVFDMGHVSLSRNDPRFWDYNIRELALYDLPALVEHVKKETGYDKVAFIGHSQGNATMFVSLARGMVPDLGHSLSCFVALAPAVYSGPLTHGFPFTAIKHMDWKSWKRIFGVLDFIPVMRWSYDYVPSYPFALLGYQMFAFLFEWTDANWLLRRKPKMFRFTPSPVPSAGIFWWTGLNGFSSRGCVLNPDVVKWYDKRFPPLAIYHGGKDYLVLAEKLLDRLRTNEPDVKVIRVHKLEEGEHCDNFWDVDAVENSFVHILQDIESTRPRYPEECDQRN